MRSRTRAQPTVKGERAAAKQAGAPPAQAPPVAQDRRPPTRPAPATSAAAPAPAETSVTSRERWVVTELRRQALTTESALRELGENVEQLGRTLKQVVDALPKLAQARPDNFPVEALAHRIDEMEARLEARLDEAAGAAVAPRAGVPVDTAGVRAEVRAEMEAVSAQLEALGERVRAELVTAAGQAEARLNRDREQLRDALAKMVARVDNLMGATVSRDDLRQYWVEMAAKLAKQHELVAAEREQLRRDLGERFDQLAAERDELRHELVVRDRGAGADTKPLQAALASQRATVDELRRELQQLGARLLAAAIPTVRPQASLDKQTMDTLRTSMAEAAAAFSRAASKDDVETLRTQLAGTVTRLERSFQRRLEQDQYLWEERLGAALEGVRLALEAADVSRQAMMGEASSAVRAALGAILPPLPGA